MTRAWFITRVPSVGPGAGRQRAARPDGAFIQMRQEFGADDAAEHQIRGCAQRRHSHRRR